MTAPGNRAAMKKSQRELRAAAGDLLGQLWPPSVLRDARELLLKVQRDEVFREYLAARLWAVLAMLLLFVLISTVCATDIMFNSVRLIWLEGRAAQKDRSARGIRVAVPPGVLAHLKYSRALPAWILVALCVAVPLAIVAGHAPLLALLLVALAILAPVLFKKFDS